MAHTSDAQILAQTHNTARFFTETRHVAWVLLLATVLWGVYGYLTCRSARIRTFRSAGAGASALAGRPSEKVEELVTRRSRRRSPRTSR